MRLITFRIGGQLHVGAVSNDQVVALDAVLLEAGHSVGDMIAFLRLGDPGIARADELVHAALTRGEALPRLDEIELLAPIPRPPKIMMGGRNYVRHVQEMQKTEAFAKVAVPKFPRIFAKYAVAVNAPGAPVYQPAISDDIDFEAELSVVIGKDARDVDEIDAYTCIAGYTIVNDVTARDLQAMDELTLAKSFEGFAPMGPWIVTKDEIPDPHNLTVRTYLNDRQLMENNTSEMLHRIPAFVAFLSKAFPLEVGDIITTGSPPGPGKFLDPPALPRPGDLMRVEVEGIGILENRLMPPRG